MRFDDSDHPDDGFDRGPSFRRPRGDPPTRRSAEKRRNPHPGLRSGSASSYSPATIARFRSNCIDCHDPDGRGEGGRQIDPERPRLHRPPLARLANRSMISDARSSRGRGAPCPRCEPRSSRTTRVVWSRSSGGLEEAGSSSRISRREIPPRRTPSDPRRTKSPASEALPSRGASASRRNPEAIRREAAEAAFRLSCRKCHGDDGKGDPLRGLLPSIPDFTNRHWQEGTSKAQLAASILEGKSTHMPAFRSKLGTAQVDDLVAYVRAFVPSQRDSIGHQPEDFERRLAELQKEFDELRRAYRGLSPPPRQN